MKNVEKLVYICKRVRNICLFFISLLIITMFSGKNVCSDTIEDEKSRIEEAVESELKTGEFINNLWYYDYDKNGRYEAFIIVGYNEDDNIYDEDDDIYDDDNIYDDEYDIYEDDDIDEEDNIDEDSEYGSYGLHKLLFAYDDGNKIITKLIARGIGEGYQDCKSGPMFLEDATLFIGYYIDEYTSCNIYIVKGNSVSICSEFKSFQSVRYIQGNDFSSALRTFDAGGMYEAGLLGTWGSVHNRYYFYYKNGKIHEYVAHEISLKELKKYKNASKILKEYKKLGKNGGIYSILLRENNLIHINYFSVDSKDLSYTFNNLTLKVLKNSVSVADKKTTGGIDAVSQGEISKIAYTNVSASGKEKLFPFGSVNTNRRKALKVYYDYLTSSDNNATKFYIIDMTGDKIPELALFDKNENKWKIYKYANGKMKFYMNFHNIIGYYPNKHIIEHKNSYAPKYYFILKKSEYNIFAQIVSKYSFSHNKINTSYIFEKKEVSKDVFNSKLKKVLGQDKIIKFKNVAMKNKNLNKWYKKNF